jgi:hypothetical protein
MQLDLVQGDPGTVEYATIGVAGHPLALLGTGTEPVGLRCSSCAVKLSGADDPDNPVHRT